MIMETASQTGGNATMTMTVVIAQMRNSAVSPFIICRQLAGVVKPIVNS